MSAEFVWLTSSSSVDEYIEKTQSGVEHMPAITMLGDSVLDFARCVFPGTTPGSVYAQYRDREYQGKGAHFDVYDERLQQDHQRIGVYNLAGSCAVRAAILPPALSETYDALFPEATHEAKLARRHLSEVAFLTPGVEVRNGQMDPSWGLILPQHVGGPDIVHAITPFISNDPGSYIKLLVPDHQNFDSVTAIKEEGYQPLDKLLEAGIMYWAKRNRSVHVAVPPQVDQLPEQRTCSDGSSDSLLD
jgi:hypothetical protein